MQPSEDSKNKWNESVRINQVFKIKAYSHQFLSQNLKHEKWGHMRRAASRTGLGSGVPLRLGSCQTIDCMWRRMTRELSGTLSPVLFQGETEDSINTSVEFFSTFVICIRSFPISVNLTFLFGAKEKKNQSEMSWLTAVDVWAGIWCGSTARLLLHLDLSA